ncbi:MAG: hypothetical protein WD929_05250 [Steroidobacteraceae bacterium]
MNLRRSHRLRVVLAALLAVQVTHVRAESAAGAEPVAFAEQVQGLEQRIAELAAVDPLQPDTLDARVALARLLQDAAVKDCLPHFDAAERQLAPILAAGPEQLLAWPDGLGDTLSLLQTIQNGRGQCADDEASERAAFESAIATGLRAIDRLRENWDFEEMAIALFNVAFARRELGDLDGALQDLEQVLHWDQEFGFLGELRTDYETLLRWSAGGEEPDPAAVDRFIASFNQTKARFQFAWKPHRALWSTVMDRSSLRDGQYSSVTTRYRSALDVRRERTEWILRSTMDGVPAIESPGAVQATPDQERWQVLISGMTAALPEIVIGEDGGFKEIRDLERHRESLLKSVRELVAESKTAAAGKLNEEEIDRFLGAALNPELLSGMAAGQWDIAVAAWIGGEFDHGDWYSLSFEEALPGFSAQPITKTMSFKVSRWLPCADGREPKCVEVLVRIVPEPEGLTRAVSDFVTRLLPSAPRIELEQALQAARYTVDVRYRLVTEPDTLLPWSLEERRYVYASSIEGGKRSVMARADRTLETAEYLR